MTSCAGSESTADGQSKPGRRWRMQESSNRAGVERQWRRGGMVARSVASLWFTMLSSDGQGPLSGPLYSHLRGLQMEGPRVIIYSPQLLTLDSELIAAEGKSDRTWRVPEPVTLISVRCLQQGVRRRRVCFCQRLLLDLSTCVCVHVCVC